MSASVYVRIAMDSIVLCILILLCGIVRSRLYIHLYMFI